MKRSRKVGAACAFSQWRLGRERRTIKKKLQRRVVDIMLCIKAAAQVIIQPV